MHCPHPPSCTWSCLGAMCRDRSRSYVPCLQITAVCAGATGFIRAYPNSDRHRAQALHAARQRITAAQAALRGAERELGSLETELPKVRRATWVCHRMCDGHARSNRSSMRAFLGVPLIFIKGNA
jgi:hypothetical protein